MAAPRKYSDAQRAAMYSLYEQGYSVAEIVRRCEEGLASVAPFEIPRRTAQQIVTRIARERAQPVPKTVEELTEDDLERIPKRATRILAAELERIERI
ncbi:MAG: hypothetical protein ACR2G3_00670 [Solirubrobacterales bacterium]